MLVSECRDQVTLLPECLDDFIGEDNPVRIVDAFVGMSDGRSSVIVPLHVRRNSGRVQILSATEEQRVSKELTPLQRGLQQALLWQHMLDTGKYVNIRALAKGEGMDSSYVSQILKLTLLPADVMDAALTGTNS